MHCRGDNLQRGGLHGTVEETPISRYVLRISGTNLGYEGMSRANVDYLRLTAAVASMLISQTKYGIMRIYHRKL